MNLLTVKKKFIRNLTILTIGVTVLTILVFRQFFPERYFVCYPFIPLYFYLFGLIYGYVFPFIYQYSENKVLPVFLVFRGINFFLSIAAVVGCGLIAPHHIVSFGIIYAVYYLIYLGLETYFFFQLESEMKQKKKGSM